MRSYYGLNKVGKFKQSVAVLGVFDGVHLGHRHILQAAVKKAAAINGTSIALTFYPHPQKKGSLYSLAHRLRLIAETGIDACVIINFSPAFAKMKAEDFIRKVIAKKIGARLVYVGENFRFGKGAKGDCRILKKLSERYNYEIKVFKAIKTNRRLISSTRIRRLIIEGKLRQAQKLLNRPVTVLGTVIKGISLARQIGFPTANINPHHEILPPSGVYAVRVVFNAKVFKGVCNIGKKPTVLLEKGRREKHVEVHIFDFNKNIYGKDLEIQFVKKIRKERKFSALKNLAGQISKDSQKAKKILTS